MEFDLIKEISKAQKGLNKKQIYYTKKELETLHQYIMKQNECIYVNDVKQILSNSMIEFVSYLCFF